MKFFTHYLLFLTSLLFSAELKHVTIGNQDFSIVTDTYDIYDSKGEVMKLYKEERNHNLTFQLSLILKDVTGTCADKSIQEGAYEINGTEIILYSFWDRKGKVYDVPYGVRVSRYEILDDHTVIKKSSYIYIESERKNDDEESGMKYLFNAPKTDNEKEKLHMYIQEMERKYKGTFVYENDAKILINDVKKALKRKRTKRWKRG